MGLSKTTLWRRANPDGAQRHREQEEKRRRENPEDQIARVLRQRLNKYRLTIDELHAFQERFDESGCAVCGDYEDTGHLDHNHQTGKVRAMLCGLCNHGIGHFKDDPSRMRAAANYIEVHS